MIDSQTDKEISMRYTKLMLVLLGFAAALSAADPFTGTWKMNAAKTKFKAGAAPKEQAVVISEAGNDFNVKVTGVAADGSPIAMAYTMPQGGGPGMITEGGGSYDGISGKRIGPNEREVTYTKGGKTVYTTHSKLAANGDSLMVSAKGVN